MKDSFIPPILHTNVSGDKDAAVHFLLVRASREFEANDEANGMRHQVGFGNEEAYLELTDDSEKATVHAYEGKPLHEYLRELQKQKRLLYACVEPQESILVSPFVTAIRFTNAPFAVLSMQAE